MEIKPVVLNIRQAAKYLGLSKGSIVALEKSGTFPQRKQLTLKRKAFLVADIDSWLANLPVADGI